MSNPYDSFSDEQIGSWPPGESPDTELHVDTQHDQELSLSEKSRSLMYPEELRPEYPLMEELPLKPPPQYPMQTQQPAPLEVGESAITRREEALAIKFAVLKFIDYLFFLLLVLELIFLTRLLLKLIGASPNNLFAGFLYGLSDLLLFPFSGIAPSPMIHPLNQPLEISTLVGMFVYFLVFFVIARFLKILISSPKSIEEELDLEPPKASNERAFASKFAITQVRSFYENVHRQFKPWLYFSVIAITLGTLCIASIYIIPYLGKFFPISDNITTIITLIIAAGSLYSIAIVSFLQNRKAYKQVDSYYSDKLNEVAKISQLVAVASRTPVSESQEHINEKIISQILLPLGKEKIGQENFNTVSDEILKLEHTNK